MVSPTSGPIQTGGASPLSSVSRFFSGAASAMISAFDVIEDPAPGAGNVNLLKMTPPLLDTFSNELRMIDLARKSTINPDSKEIFHFCHTIMGQARMEHPHQDLRIKRAKLVIGQVFYLMDTHFDALLAILRIKKKEAINHIRDLFDRCVSLSKQKLQLIDTKNKVMQLQHTNESRKTCLAVELCRFLVTSQGCLNSGIVDYLFEKIEVESKEWNEFLVRLSTNPRYQQLFLAVQEPAQDDSEADDLIRAQLGREGQFEVTVAHARQCVLSAVLTRLPYPNAATSEKFAARDLEFFGNVLQNGSIELLQYVEDPFLKHAIVIERNGLISGKKIFVWELEGLQAAAKQMSLSSIEAVWDELKVKLCKDDADGACCTSAEIIGAMAEIQAAKTTIGDFNKNSNTYELFGRIGYSAAGMHLLGRMAPSAQANNDGKVQSCVGHRFKAAPIILSEGSGVECIEKMLEECQKYSFLPAEPDFREKVLQFAQGNLISMEIALPFQEVMREMDKQFEKPLSIENYLRKLLDVVNGLMNANEMQKTKNHQMLSTYLFNEGLDKAIRTEILSKAIPVAFDGISLHPIERDFYLVFDPVCRLPVRAACTKDKLDVEIIDELTWDRFVAL